MSRPLAVVAGEALIDLVATDDHGSPRTARRPYELCDRDERARRRARRDAQRPVVRVPAVPVQVVDTIGAGDAFAGGLIAWWSDHHLGRAGWGDRDAVIAATRFASLVAGPRVRTCRGRSALAPICRTNRPSLTTQAARWQVHPSDHLSTPRPTRRRPTIRDVARLAEVSPSTVSRVVNGRRVAPELVERVSSAVDALGYRRNVGARSLRRLDAASATIGVILEDVSNPFFAAVHRGVEDVARGRSVITLAGSSDEHASLERGLAEAFLARRVDGLVMVPALGARDHSYLFRDMQAGRPMVFVDRLPRFVDADVVLSDNVGGARTAVAHLAASGHRRVAFLGDHEELFTAQERLRGYREAVAHHGLDEDPRLIRHLGFRAAGVRTATHELLQRCCPATALFTAQNLVTSGALCLLHEERRQHDVALVGFDELPLDGLLSPPVAVVVQDPYAMGRTAAELLFSRLDGYRGPSRRCMHPTRLVARPSGSIPPAA